MQRNQIPVCDSTFKRDSLQLQLTATYHCCSFLSGLKNIRYSQLCSQLQFGMCSQLIHMQKHSSVGTCTCTLHITHEQFVKYCGFSAANQVGKDFTAGQTFLHIYLVFIVVAIYVMYKYHLQRYRVNGSFMQQIQKCYTIQTDFLLHVQGTSASYRYT